VIIHQRIQYPLSILIIFLIIKTAGGKRKGLNEISFEGNALERISSPVILQIQKIIKYFFEEVKLIHPKN